jgi:hypothetical protein
LSPTEATAFSTLISRGVANRGDEPDEIFQKMLDALPVAIYLTDADGRLTYFNPAAVKLAGRVPELGTDRWCVTWKIILPDGTQLPHDQCPMAVVLRGGEVPMGIEAMAERPDGTRRWVTPCPAVIRNNAGEIIGGINLLVDITDRKTAELEAREQFRTIVETSPECFKLVAADGTLLFMNAQGLAMVGAPAPEAVIGGNVYDLIAPEDRALYRAFNESVCRGEKGSLQFDIVGLKGVRCHMETHAAPLQHMDGTTVQLAITRNITSRRQAERSAQLLASIVDSSDDAIISKDLNGIITSWNKSAERMFGYVAAEIVGKSVTILIPSERLDEETQILARLRRGERVDHFETMRRRKDGTLIDISLTISPVRDRHGAIVGASKIARDISLSKRIEDDLRRANQDLEQFAYSASHDLQEPLRNVKIFSELLFDRYNDKLDGRALEYLHTVHDGASRMEILVRDLLSYTQTGTPSGLPELVDANIALKNALTNLSGAIGESEAAIHYEPLPNVPVNAAQLQQLFQNLIGNAVKYRRPDVAPVVRTAARRQNGDWVFSVADNGIGIRPEYSERIFGLFKRLHTGEEYPGTGIGLALCQRIVERHQGRIWVESQPGEGSTFYFTLPAGEPAFSSHSQPIEQPAM